MSEETTGDQSGVLKGRNGAPPPGGALGHTIHDWRGRDFPSARGPNLCGQMVNTPGDRLKNVGLTINNAYPTWNLFANTHIEGRRRK